MQVMRFHGPHCRFELILAGRPDGDGWCLVRVAVEGPDGNWSGASRCLLVEEVARLAEWLEAAAARPANRFGTLDNEISFELLDTEPRQLRVHLGWAFRPVRAQSEAVTNFFRNYPVTGRNLRQAARSLREQLREVTKTGPADRQPDR